ncbi:hypothetical protein WJX81_008034 [Elliptochloris bilobata]|uniref:Uncharacterized protein n=1 Tax=Elliptochloris bilobata TaxID=381761 RepID=A0AAW1RPC5_9CHLO
MEASPAPSAHHVCTDLPGGAFLGEEGQPLKRGLKACAEVVKRARVCSLDPPAQACRAPPAGGTVPATVRGNDLALLCSEGLDGDERMASCPCSCAAGQAPGSSNSCRSDRSSVAVGSSMHALEDSARRASAADGVALASSCQALCTSPPQTSGGTAAGVTCLLGEVASHFGFAPLAIAAGISHLRRLAACDAELRAMGASCPAYAPLLAPGPTCEALAVPAVRAAPLADWQGGVPRLLPDRRRWLTALALTCVLLAAKNLDRPLILLRQPRQNHKHRKRHQPPKVLHSCGDLASAERLAPPKKRALLAGISALLAW